MSLLQFQHAINFSVLECARCRVPFALLNSFMSDRRLDHDTFYCPSGHENHYPGESSVEKLQRSLDSKNKNISDLRIEISTAKAETKLAQYRERGQKAAKTRLANRIKNGVCPCCNRTFVALAKHISTQHPEYQVAD